MIDSQASLARKHFFLVALHSCHNAFYGIIFINKHDDVFALNNLDEVEF
jgi:hypothetical protein